VALLLLLGSVLVDKPDHPLGDAVETFSRREDAERFVDEVRGDDPQLAANLRIDERELETGGPELALLPPEIVGSRRAVRSV
jgi:hypothetical protein